MNIDHGFRGISHKQEGMMVRDSSLIPRPTLFSVAVFHATDNGTGLGMSLKGQCTDIIVINFDSNQRREKGFELQDIHFLKICVYPLAHAVAMSTLKLV